MNCRIILTFLMLLTLMLTGCSKQSTNMTQLRHFPLDSENEIIAQAAIQIDKVITSDGNGSIQIDATGSMRVRLIELGDLDIENAQLVYQAQMRCENLKGEAFLEMWCQFENLGEYFSRDMQSPLSGTTGWRTEETSFFLQQDQNPDSIKLYLVVNGSGKVWIDDIHLLKRPL